MAILSCEVEEFKLLKKHPKALHYEGDLALLEHKKISIVGTRKPSLYTQHTILHLASMLAKSGACVVSGAALGCDAFAHRGAGSASTIAVLPCGVDLYYPATNRSLLESIARDGLLLSQFDLGFEATPWSFVARNELVVALGEVLVVAEADLKSGTMRSVEFALSMGKQIFVLPHRLGESRATHELLKSGEASAIHDIDEFVEWFCGRSSRVVEDSFLEFCKSSPTYDEALSKFASRVYEAELSGEIVVQNGRVVLA